MNAMQPLELLDLYYPQPDRLKEILLDHSRAVADKALWIADRHPELELNRTFLFEAAMLHDIGIFLTDAKDICCFGTAPYICHGYLGAELVNRHGFPRHAWVCERHTGAGITIREITERNLPIPCRDMQPVSLEEQVICFADKFYSKSRLGQEKTIEGARKSIAKHGPEGVVRFDNWCKIFL